MAFTIKRNDRLPELEVICKDADGNVVDLTAADSAKFLMKATNGSTPKVDAAATITSPSAGRIKYSWAASDTDTAGTYNGEFEVSFPGPKLETFPNSEYIAITIVADLG